MAVGDKQPVPGDVYDAAIRTIGEASINWSAVNVMEEWLREQPDYARQLALRVIEQAGVNGIARICRG